MELLRSAYSRKKSNRYLPVLGLVDSNVFGSGNHDWLGSVSCCGYACTLRRRQSAGLERDRLAARLDACTGIRLVVANHPGKWRLYGTPAKALVTVPFPGRHLDLRDLLMVFQCCHRRGFAAPAFGPAAAATPVNSALCSAALWFLRTWSITRRARETGRMPPVIITTLSQIVAMSCSAC